jgi:hypothetical protein
MRLIGSSLFNRTLDRIVLRIVVAAGRSEKVASAVDEVASAADKMAPAAGKVASAVLLETYGQPKLAGSCREVRLAGTAGFDGSHYGKVDFALGTTTKTTATLKSSLDEWPRPTPTPVKNGIGFTTLDVAGVGNLQTYDHFVATTNERVTPADDIYMVGRVNGGSGSFAGTMGEIIYQIKRSNGVSKWEARGQVCR